MRRTAAEILTWCALLLVLNMILISSVTPLELLVGAAGAGLGAAGAHAVRRASGAKLGGLAHLGLAAWCWPWTLLTETGQLLLAVVRPGRTGAFRRIELADGTGPAWACVLLSATPGAYAVDVAPGPGPRPREVTVHTFSGDVSALERALTEGGHQR